MKAESFDVEKTVMEIILEDDVAKKRRLAKKIFNAAYERGFILQASMNFIWLAAEANSLVSQFPQ